MSAAPMNSLRSSFGDEAVVEDDVVADAEILGEVFQAGAVFLALAGDQVRMGGAEHQIDRLRVALDDFRHRADGVFDALAGAEQAEGEQHGFARHAELVS